MIDYPSKRWDEEGNNSEGFRFELKGDHIHYMDRYNRCVNCGKTRDEITSTWGKWDL